MPKLWYISHHKNDNIFGYFFNGEKKYPLFIDKEVAIEFINQRLKSPEKFIPREGDFPPNSPKKDQLIIIGAVLPAQQLMVSDFNNYITYERNPPKGDC